MYGNTESCQSRFGEDRKFCVADPSGKLEQSWIPGTRSHGIRGERRCKALDLLRDDEVAGNAGDGVRSWHDVSNRRKQFGSKVEQTCIAAAIQLEADCK